MKFEVHKLGSRVIDSTHDNLKEALTWIAKECDTNIRNISNRRYADGSHSVHIIDGRNSMWAIMENDGSEDLEKIPTPMMDRLESDAYETISNFITWMQDEKDVYIPERLIYEYLNIDKKELKREQDLLIKQQRELNKRNG